MINLINIAENNRHDQPEESLYQVKQLKYTIDGTPKESLYLFIN